MKGFRDFAPYILAGLTALGAVGTGAGVINTNDQAELRLVAIEGMAEALAQQSRLLERCTDVSDDH